MMDNNGKFSRAQTAALLRTVVAGYIMYLGWKIATNTEESSMSPLVAKLIGGVFIAAAIGFGIYVFKRWKADSAAEKLAAEEAEEREDGE